MKVILGLGNPGPAYERTRHNVGWWVVDHLADVWRFGAWRRDGDSHVAGGQLGGEQVRLMKPQTFMNLSGAALRAVLRKPEWVPATDLLVVVDDVALPVGRYRLRAAGSAGGHNGLKSVERAVGGPQYARLRIGIQPIDPAWEIDELAEFVLSPFSRIERERVLELMPRFADAAEMWVREGIERAMNVHNRELATE